MTLVSSILTSVVAARSHAGVLVVGRAVDVEVHRGELGGRRWRADRRGLRKSAHPGNRAFRQWNVASAVEVELHVVALRPQFADGVIGRRTPQRGRLG